MKTANVPRLSKADFTIELLAGLSHRGVKSLPDFRYDPQCSRAVVGAFRALEQLFDDVIDTSRLDITAHSGYAKDWIVEMRRLVGAQLDPVKDRYLIDSDFFSCGSVTNSAVPDYIWDFLAKVFEDTYRNGDYMPSKLFVPAGTEDDHRRIVQTLITIAQELGAPRCIIRTLGESAELDYAAINATLPTTAWLNHFSTSMDERAQAFVIVRI